MYYILWCPKAGALHRNVKHSAHVQLHMALHVAVFYIIFTQSPSPDNRGSE